MKPTHKRKLKTAGLAAILVGAMTAAVLNRRLDEKMDQLPKPSPCQSYEFNNGSLKLCLYDSDHNGSPDYYEMNVKNDLYAPPELDFNEIVETMENNVGGILNDLLKMENLFKQEYLKKKTPQKEKVEADDGSTVL